MESRIFGHSVWLLGLVLGCTGTVQSDGRGESSATPGGMEDGSTDPPEVTEAACESAPLSPGPSPIRRLTRAEYGNTLRDLLGTALPEGVVFPEEELSLGYPNQAAQQTVSTLLVEAHEAAAHAVAEQAVEDPTALLGCDPKASGEDACAASFISSFGQRAFRRPLMTDEVERLTTFYTTSKQTYDFVTAVRMTAEAILESPHFLYRVESFGAQAVTRITGYEMATRLSYALWGSMPDTALLVAAGAGELDSDEGVRTQAQRMVEDPRALDVVLPQFSYWLDLGRVKKAQKDPAVFPAFTSSIRELLFQETELFVVHAFQNGNQATLFLDSTTFMNQELAAYYGVSGPNSDAFEPVTLDPARYAGILTRAGLQAGSAKADQTSPVARGFFVRDRLLCAPPAPPPNTVDVNPPALDPSLTTRARFAAHRTDPACAGCHTLMDPIGFGFEHFDGAGLWRNDENGLAIDSTGEFSETDDLDGTFDGAIELSQKLSDSEQVAGCAVRQWFRFAYGRGEIDADACTLLELERTFSESQKNWKALLVALTSSDAFVYRTNEGVEP